MNEIKVMICGSYDAFSLGLIAKIKKENNEIFIISGTNHTTRKKPAEVFQEYCFPYTAPSIEFIMSNVLPDAVIFLGALDTGYEWSNEGKEAVNYISGFLNILLTAKAAGVKKFLYLSSYAVFEDNTEDVITEESLPKPNSLYARTLLQGENACFLHNEEHAFEVSVIRAGQVYGNYKDMPVKNNIIYWYLWQKDINIEPYKEYNLIYVDDLLDGIYKVMTTKLENKLIYHIGSEESVLGTDILLKLSSYVKSDKEKNATETFVSMTDSSNATKRKFINGSIKSLGYIPKYNLDAGIRRMNTAIINRTLIERKQNDRHKKNKFFKKGTSKILPYIENIVLFVIIQLVISATWGFAFHETIDLYLWYTLLIVSVHGLAQGKLAIILSVLGKYSMEIMKGESYFNIFEYNSYLWILQIIVIGTLAAYGRDKYKRLMEDLADENEYLQKEYNSIKEINTSNVIVKTTYERRLLNQKNSMGRIYEIIAQLDSLEPQNIVFEAIDVISQIMNTKDIAIYTCDSRSDYCRLMAASSVKAKTMGKSICLSDTGELGECLRDKKIYRNTGLNPNYPLIAGATHEDDKIESVIMVWSLEIEDTNLNQVNVFSIICKLMERSMARAYAYMESIHSSSYLDNSIVMTEQAFDKVLVLYSYGKERNMLEYSLLQVESSSVKENEMYQLLKKLTRDTDYIGLGDKKQLYVLLTNTNQQDAIIVINRLRENGILVSEVNE